MLGCGTSPHEWGNLWVSNSLVKICLSSLLTITPYGVWTYYKNGNACWGKGESTIWERNHWFEIEGEDWAGGSSGDSDGSSGVGGGGNHSFW